MLDNPRPAPRYWKLMLYYSVSIFFIKYSLQLTMLELVMTQYFGFSLKDYKDPYKTGFSLCSLTYSESLFYYTIWDVLCICGIICHEYILLKSGLSEKSEYDVETLQEAKYRLGLAKGEESPPSQPLQPLPPLQPLEPLEEPEQKSAISRSYQDIPGELLLDLHPGRAISEHAYPKSESHQSFHYDDENSQSEGPIRRFFHRLLPFDSEEKPGHDLYTYTIIMQMLILFCIILLYTHMDGESQDISLAIK